MKKIFKKSLAIMVSAAICLTALIGCLSVSAATRGEGTFTVGSDSGKPGELVTVPIELAYTSSNGEDGMGIGASLFDVSFDTDALTITDIAAGEDATYTPDLGDVPGGEDVPPQDIYTVEYRSTEGETISVVDGAVRILAMPADNETVLTSMTVNLTFTINEGAAAQDYAITITKQQTCDYGQATPDGFGSFTYADNEEFIAMSITEGAVTVVEDQTTEPVRIDATLLQHDLLLTESVGSVIAVNVSANGGLKTLGYDDYYLTIEYEKYASGYNLETKTLTLNPEDRDRQNAAQTVDFFNFTDIALYEMPLDYTVTIYLKNTEGSTVAYTDDVTSITKQALAYAQKYSTDIKLLTTLADMVNYGASVQNFFATTNPGADIESAVLPTVGFEEYQQYASDASDLPEVFNTTKENIKKLESTTLQADASVLISSSNSIRYQFLATGYEVSELKAEISYTDSYGYLITKTVDFSDMELNSAGGRAIYSYTFTNLAIYDLEKTVSVSLKYNDSEELEFNYSVGNFVNTYINVDDYNDVLTKMELFSQSARIKLVGA